MIGIKCQIRFSVGNSKCLCQNPEWRCGCRLVSVWMAVSRCGEGLRFSRLTQLSSSYHLRDNLFKQDTTRLWLPMSRSSLSPEVTHSLWGCFDNALCPAVWKGGGVCHHNWVTGRRAEPDTALGSPAVRSYQLCQLAMSLGKWSSYWSPWYEMAFQAGDLICFISTFHMGWKEEGSSLTIPRIMYGTTSFLLDPEKIRNVPNHRTKWEEKRSQCIIFTTWQRPSLVILKSSNILCAMKSDFDVLMGQC